MGQELHQFDNGYGASVVDYGYGEDDGLLEIAVLHADNKQICYATPVTDDVIGWRTEEEIEVIIEAIRELPRNDNCTHSRERKEEV